MSCRKECMQKTACRMHPCRSKGFCQAGPGQGSVPCEHNMRARGTGCCINVRNNMENDACMPKLRHGGCPRCQITFLGTSEIGGSRKARLKAPGHAMEYSNESTCIKRQGKLCLGCMACTCACGKSPPARNASCARRVQRRVFPAEQVSSST